MVDFAGQTNVRIVGVIPDVHETDLEADPGWQVYLSILQKAWGPSATHLILRSNLAPAAYASVVMEKIRAINPSQPRVDFLPIQSYVDHATSPRRFFAMLVGLFATLGVVLASLGIYGVISYSVTRQTQEIGIRIALGATRERVQRAVIGRTLRLALIGITVGSAASFVVAKTISSMLFGTQPTDPITFTAMILLLLTVAFFAGYLPGRRASRIDPMVALRSN